MSSGSPAANAEPTHPAGGPGVTPERRSILARTANKAAGDVQWIPGGER